MKRVALLFIAACGFLLGYVFDGGIALWDAPRPVVYGPILSGLLVAFVCRIFAAALIKDRPMEPLSSQRKLGPEIEADPVEIHYIPCPHCGKQIADKAITCGHCWQKIVPAGARLLRASVAPPDEGQLLRPATSVDTNDMLLLRLEEER